MISFKRVNRQTGFLVTVGALLVAFVAPGLVPAFASADQVSDRSIELSTSSKDASPVDYSITFTPVKTAGAFVVEFCTNTPVIQESCTAPGGFVINSATSTDTVKPLTADAANRVEVTKTLTAATPVTVKLSGVHNPTLAGQMYARIVTYDTEANALTYDTTTLGTGAAGVQDQGSVALEITDTIGVNAAVLESMTFCVSKDPISNCSTTTTPTLQLGKTTGTIVALDPSEVSTGNIYTQISTNASSGAVVNLKSSAAGCGGLINSSKPTGCFIAPAQNTDIAFGQAKFGVKTATATGGSDIFEPVSGSHYNNSTYALNYDTSNTNATGVTGPYGDPFLDTGGAVANNMNMALTFGASASNSTPAGNYSASLSLIATGKF